MLFRLLRLYHTIKPLRFEQIFYRLWYRFFPLSKLTPSPGFYSVKNWVWSALEVVKPSIISQNEVEFLNQKASITNSSVWNEFSYEKLWLYNLHYFDDLNAVDSLSRKDIQYTLVIRWIAENLPVKGNGWEPYPLSIRLVNWVKWYNRAGIDDQAIVNSIAKQAEALSKQLEYHILGNHLFANAKALVFVGCFLDGPEGEKYLKLGLKLLDREIPEQFLNDGGHFELSPMYHSILLWDLLDLVNLAQLTGEALLNTRLGEWKSRVIKALNWLNSMVHADGEISFFNDSTIGIAASPNELIDYAVFLGISVDVNEERYTLLKDSGYSRINTPLYRLFFDHAEVGPSYLPGHAHADTLSFELSMGVSRFFVNSGTSLYGLTDERHRQRGTLAHNTVTINDTDSSEVWGGFRVARRAHVTNFATDASDKIIKLTAEHGGYTRLKCVGSHRREVLASNDVISINDHVSGSYDSAVAVYHLHPDIQVNAISNSRLELISVSGGIVIFNSSEPIKLEATTYHPAFGVSMPNKRIMIPFLSNGLTVNLDIKEGH